MKFIKFACCFSFLRALLLAILLGGIVFVATLAGVPYWVPAFVLLFGFAATVIFSSSHAGECRQCGGSVDTLLARWGCAYHN